MAVVSRVFFDTSVLLAGLVDLGPASRSAIPLLDSVARREVAAPRTAWHCCLELYSVSTRLPEEFRLTPEDAMALIESEVLARFEILALPSGARRGFLRSASLEGIRGGRLYDAHIAEIARRGRSAQVVTENRRHFASLERHGIPVLTAEEALSRLRRASRGGRAGG